MRLANGEQFTLLVDIRNGLPVPALVDYGLVFHRGKSANSTVPIIDTIGQFLSWAEDCGVNLDERFGTGELFTSHEITGLVDHMWIRRKSPNQSTRSNKPISDSVVGATHASRIDRVISFVEWRTARTVSAMSVHDQRARNINDRLLSIVAQFKSLKGSSVSTPRGSLSEDQCARLFEIVRPGSAANPFHRETQLRNFVILLIYYELGVRKAEPLVIKGSHLAISGRSTLMITYTPDDPRDPRKRQPRVKTRSRLLPISRILAASATKWMKERHTNDRIRVAAKRTPFVFVDTDQGRPLSLDAVYDIFVVLRTRFQDVFPDDFAPHHLRRSWNYRFSVACKNAGVPSELEDHLRRYIMGWSKTSAQPANYNQKYIEEQAFNILFSMQNSLTLEDVQ
jgi:hypothetical protein